MYRRRGRVNVQCVRVYFVSFVSLFCYLICLILYLAVQYFNVKVVFFYISPVYYVFHFISLFWFNFLIKRPHIECFVLPHRMPMNGVVWHCFRYCTHTHTFSVFRCSLNRINSKWSSIGTYFFVLIRVSRGVNVSWSSLSHSIRRCVYFLFMFWMLVRQEK